MYIPNLTLSGKAQKTMVWLSNRKEEEGLSELVDYLALEKGDFTEEDFKKYYKKEK